MKEITPEQIKACGYIKTLHAESHRRDGDCGIAACRVLDYARDTTAALMRSEFEREHELMDTDHGDFCDACNFYLLTPVDRQLGNTLDPRHLFQFEQWQQVADKYCRGEAI